MTRNTEPGSVPEFDLSPGLIEYYSSQAELMLAQYENVNRLLGPTSHGTASGDLCEILFRDLLRRFLPKSWSVDKGYFYGRSVINGTETHSPEIDVLIHDTASHAPISRFGDFVVVKPQSVRAMIQVKRTLNTAQAERGVRNVAQAKQQLVDVLWKEHVRKSSDRHAIELPNVFTGVIGFGCSQSRDLQFYKDLLLAVSLEHRAYDRRNQVETSMFVLPHFIGSLQEYFVLSSSTWRIGNQVYAAYDSKYRQEPIVSPRRHERHGAKDHGRNLCIQAMLAKMSDVLLRPIGSSPPFAFPENYKDFGSFGVLDFEVRFQPERGNVLLCRNDGWIAIYDIAQGPTRKPHHYTVKMDGTHVKELLLIKDLAPEEFLVNVETPGNECTLRFVRRAILSPSRLQS